MTSHLTKGERNGLLIGIFLSSIIGAWVTTNSLFEAVLFGFLGIGSVYLLFIRGTEFRDG